MQYLHFKTRSLASLVDGYNGGSFPWEKLGTSAKAINLDKIDGGNTCESAEDGTAYLLPIINLFVAEGFIKNSLTPFNIDAEILTEEEALKQWEQYKLLRQKDK